MPGPSHYMAGNTLMKILAEQGHEVTIVAVLSENNPPKNFKQVVLTGVFEDFMANINLFEKHTESLTFSVIIHSIFANAMTENLYGHENFQKLMKSGETFDLVIMEDFLFEGIKYVAHHFNAPLIVYSTVDATVWMNPYQGNPDSPSYAPLYYLSTLDCEMTFFQRTQNTFAYLLEHFVRHLYRIPRQNSIVHKYYPDAPDLNNIIYNVSLALLNADSSVQEPLPRVPSMVNIGGFHIKTPKPLPKDLLEEIESSKDGVILFTLGSTVKSKDMPEDIVKILLKTFSKLKQKVLWKYEDENLIGCPENVIIRKWLPQNDILAHKNVKLFITHGGLFSIMETIYHGVPILALPVFSDQAANSKRAVANGIGKLIPFHELQENILDAYLEEVLNNPKYKENAVKRSQIMLDKPMTPADSLNYWVNYVIRHNGASHLRVSSLNLAWYQYLLLDVVLFISLLSIILFYITKLIFKRLLRKISKKEKTT
ncbi:hypothetical protein WA026_018919 [Henosepilachna vigintioctopunctata]|uniref:UDP-glucuronosyltransferase n=1 Tax=Henosepilachna vigintioctopunctata TaxID=420089 RepID=A0AAW1ULF8_9CUCU